MPVAINQKNYYTEYMKRDDQALATRSQGQERRDRRVKEWKDKDRAQVQVAVATGDVDVDMDEEPADEGVTATTTASRKTVVIHLGSSNMRIGLAHDALPKTVLMCIARKAEETEFDDLEPRPKRLKREDGTAIESEDMFGPEVGHYLEDIGLPRLSPESAVSSQLSECGKRSQDPHARAQASLAPQLA